MVSAETPNGTAFLAGNDKITFITSADRVLTQNHLRIEAGKNHTPDRGYKYLSVVFDKSLNSAIHRSNTAGAMFVRQINRAITRSEILSRQVRVRQQVLIQSKSRLGLGSHVSKSLKTIRSRSLKSIDTTRLSLQDMHKSLKRLPEGIAFGFPIVMGKNIFNINLQGRSEIMRFSKNLQTVMTSYRRLLLKEYKTGEKASQAEILVEKNKLKSVREYFVNLTKGQSNPYTRLAEFAVMLKS
ncbi:hypothetical protein ACFL52_05195 [Candidatus Margulisiibacteriota bacterium]